MAALAQESKPTEGSLSDWEGGREVNEEVRIVFADPEKGTPAFNALEANRQHQVTQIDKHVKRHMKRPKKKHIIGSRKKESRKDRANIKGKVIDGEHEQYLLTMGMMMGIRISVNGSDKEKLYVRDFLKVDKLVFPPGGSKRTPPHKLEHTFKFKDYSPKVFAALRKLDNVDPSSYMTSVCGDFNFIQFIANSRSGQFFFYSHDGKYMIKTQTNQENRFLRRILPHYYKHMAANPDSTICKFYGMHRVKMYHLRRKLHFVVMRSVVDTGCKIHTMYDLKGSLVGRIASAKDRATGGVLKDQDLLDDKVKFKLGARREAFMKQIEADSKFLAELKIMDYSLLVGIHNRTLRDSHELKNGSIDRGENGASVVNTDGTSLDSSKTGDENTEKSSFDSSKTVKNKGKSSSFTNGAVPSPSKKPSNKESKDSDSAAEAVTVDVAVPAGGGGKPRGRSSEPSMHHHKMHSNTPLVRERSKPRGTSPNPQGRSSWAASSSQSVKDQPAANQAAAVSSGDESDKTIGVGEFNSVTDEEYDSDEDSSDSDEEGTYGLSNWVSPWGKPEPNNHGLPAKPLGEPDDEVAIPVHPVMGSFSHRRDGGITARNKDGTKGDEIYFMGIIDILQQYNSTKRAETFFKSISHDVNGISCVPPDTYGERFAKFIGAATIETE